MGVVRRSMWITGVMLAFCMTVSAQVTEPITGFETNREGVALPFQPGSFDDLKVVLFQDPRQAVATRTNIVADTAATSTNGLGYKSSEESFVANYSADFFLGHNGSSQFEDIRWEWATTNGGRTAIIETLQSPLLGDPSLHLNGIVRMWINIPDCSAFEFPTLVRPTSVGVALLIRETGKAVPQGFQDFASGRLEFVGVDSIDTNGTAPVVVPTNFYGITDTDCSGSAGDWIQVTFDLDALQAAGKVIGWPSQGGNGILNATDIGDGVNRGVLAGLVLAVPASDHGATASDYLEFLVDDITFDAPVVDPTYPPTIGTPVVSGQGSVRVKNVLSSATNVSLEIDRSDGDNEDPFTADETYNQNPFGALYLDMGVPTLAVGDRVRARQTNPSGTSAYSLVIPVNPPAAFSLTLALDEDGNFGVAPADFEWVGATSVTGTAGTQGKPVFVTPGMWQNIEFSLIPGIEPVISFAGGNGQLTPDGGNYNIDSLFFTIDPTNPTTGPYDVFVDHVYYINASNQEVLISDSELTNPFANFRGQSTAINNTSIISGLASYDGSRSNRIRWDFPDTAASNTCAPYRPAVNFADTAKAVGLWVYVNPVSTNGVPAPTISAPIVGDVNGVIVNLTTNGVTSAELFLNGVSVGSVVNTNGTSPLIFNVSALTLVVGDQFTATQTTAEGTSDFALPRGVTNPTAPAIQQPVRVNDTSVTVTDVATAQFSVASKVELFNTNGVSLGSAVPAGASVTITVAPLAVRTKIYAKQTVNTLVSPASAIVEVIPRSAACVLAWTEDFEVDPTANWTLNGGPSDESANFYFDYSTIGIPLAPHSSGSTTRGLKVQANLTGGVLSGASVSPNGKSFTGDYTVLLDWWGNFNGPLDATGLGSTNLSTFGVGTAGTAAQYPGVADCVWFGVTSDGGSSADYRAYAPGHVASYQDTEGVYSAGNQAGSRNSSHAYYAVFGGAAAPAAQLALYPQQTLQTNAGAPGMTWHEVSIAKSGSVVVWSIDGRSIATINTSTMTLGGSNLMFGHADINAGVSADPNAPALLFTLIDNIRVWVAQPAVVTFGDWNSDGIIDLSDYGHFVDCFAGPNATPAPAMSQCVDACLNTFDYNDDNDVDARDFAWFQDAY